VLLLAISVCVVSIIDFGYNAYQRANLFTSYTDPLTGQTSSDYRDPELVGRSAWGKLESDLDLHMQLDAAVALLASAAVLGISVALSKLSRRGKRLVFGAEAVVLTPIVVAILVTDQLATFG
jgi:hypothetical protein